MRKYRKYLCIVLILGVLAAGLAGLLYHRHYRHPLGLIRGIDYEYAVAVVGDTQTMNWKYPEHFLQMYDWIVENRRDYNIQYVIGLGDITDRNIECYERHHYHLDAEDNPRFLADQWQDACLAISRLNGKIPYALNDGNHDLVNTYLDEKETYNTAVFDCDYINTRLHAQPSDELPYAFDCMEYTVNGGVEGLDYGCYDPADMGTTWRKVEFQTPRGTNRFLILTIGFLYRNDEAVMDWANGLIQNDPDCPVILTTHSYMDQKLEHKTGMWEKLVFPNPNVQLVLCGHSNCKSVVWDQRENIAGLPVTEMLINPQDEGDIGAVALLYFDADGKQIASEYFSTVTNRFYDRSNQFRIP